MPRSADASATSREKGGGWIRSPPTKCGLRFLGITNRFSPRGGLFDAGQFFVHLGNRCRGVTLAFDVLADGPVDDLRVDHL